MPGHDRLVIGRVLAVEIIVCVQVFLSHHRRLGSPVHDFCHTHPASLVRDTVLQLAEAGVHGKPAVRACPLFAAWARLIARMPIAAVGGVVALGQQAMVFVRAVGQVSPPRTCAGY